MLGGPQKGAEGGAKAPEAVMNFVKKGRKTAGASSRAVLGAEDGGFS